MDGQVRCTPAHMLLVALVASFVPGGARAAAAQKEWQSPKDGKTMVYVPAGKFAMGSKLDDETAREDEQPQRQVSLSAFWIDKTEVTVGEYRRFCEATGREMPPAPSWGWQDSHPIVNVSWEDASAYAAWADKRLPTEAEWEKAARGTDGREFPWGGTAPDAGGHWRCNAEGEEDGFAHTAPVGSFPSGASPYGCLDMAGNASEWCSDPYEEDYYFRFEVEDPKGPPVTAGSGLMRVLRGGGWIARSPEALRCATRDYSAFLFTADTYGFRCARDAK